MPELDKPTGRSGKLHGTYGDSVCQDELGEEVFEYAGYVSYLFASQ